ncbi:MAG TPA: 4-hydroxy-tetrahydrodipicolinate synthase [Clostridiales bacterium]|nr:4-hydroxy-tetrahydrodipicolinate synthase [Clostridiales bacterium]HQK74179.1 4-hydroxy-tetrahydrodipicolinate synthase [Clostridiales bacterium]
MKKVLFTGAGVAIVTPFGEYGEVNYDLLEILIDYQIKNGTDAIIICGTTGEGSTLTHEEHTETIKFAADYVAGRVPVIAGTGSNDTSYAVKLSNEAEAAGVDGLLIVTPYYNKTSQEGLIAHYNFIADRVSTPIITYNVPSRTGLNIKPETYFELSKNPKIVGAKEANGDISALAKSISLCGDELAFYSGNDDQITAFMSLGAKGVISVLSNLVPRETHDMVVKYLEGDTLGSAYLQLHFLDLCNDLFIDVNPIPCKEAMVMMGWPVGECRMPLVGLSESNRAKLQATLKRHKLI